MGDAVSPYRREWFGIFQTRDGRHEVRELTSGTTIKGFKRFGAAASLRDRLCVAEAEAIDAAGRSALESIGGNHG